MGRLEIAMRGVGLVLLCFWLAVSEAEYMKYKDPKQPLNARIKDLMHRMTLEEKVGQMTQIERKLTTPDVMKKYFIGILSIIYILRIFLKCLVYFSHTHFISN